VTNLDNGKSVTVRIIDRGPHNKGRVIDLSPAAAEALDMLRAGVANVQLRPIDDGAVTARGVITGFR
jgi:rare lipoprotein A